MEQAQKVKDTTQGMGKLFSTLSSINLVSFPRDTTISEFLYSLSAKF